MANKYLRHGETFCGDGTSSAAATSNGGVGAWNNINVFTGTAPAYGSLGAGDTVFIRSKNQAGADITISNTVAGYFGSSVATVTNWVTWVIDGGSVWSGIAGTLTYSTTQNVLPQPYNKFVAEIQDKLVLYVNSTSPSNVNYFNLGTICWIENALFDFSMKTGTDPAPIACNSSTLVNPHIRYGRLGTNVPVFNFNSTGAPATIINPDIELLSSIVDGCLFSSYSGEGFRTIRITGGQLRGPGATSGFNLFSINNAWDVQFNGFQFPKDVGIVANQTSIPDSASIYGIGADGGAGGWLCEGWGTAVSMSTLNHPYLDAVLPNSTLSGWSWKLLPSNTNFMTNRVMKLALAKFYTDTAAAKTITANLLISDTMTTYDKSNLWIDVSYIDDSTGRCKSVTSKATGALDASTAAWSATGYGAVSLLKRKLSVVTPTAIKKDTMVTVTLRGTVKSVSLVSDILFVDPDVALS